ADPARPAQARGRPPEGVLARRRRVRPAERRLRDQRVRARRGGVLTLRHRRARQLQRRPRRPAVRHRPARGRQGRTGLVPQDVLIPPDTTIANPSPTRKPFQWKPRWLWWTLLVLLLLGAIVGFTAWYKIFREQPQPDWVTATPEMRFKFGSIGDENEAG